MPNGHADRQTGAARDRASDAPSPIAARSVPHRRGAARRRYGCDKRASKRVRRWAKARDNAWIAGFCQERPARCRLPSRRPGSPYGERGRARYCASFDCSLRSRSDEESSSMPSQYTSILSSAEATGRRVSKDVGCYCRNRMRSSRVGREVNPNRLSASPRPSRHARAASESSCEQRHAQIVYDGRLDVVDRELAIRTSRSRTGAARPCRSRCW